LNLKLKYLNRRVELVRNRAQLSADRFRALLREAKYLSDAGQFLAKAEDYWTEARNAALAEATEKLGRALTRAETAAALKAAKVAVPTISSLDVRQLTALPKSRAKRHAMQALVEVDMSLSVARRQADALTFRLIDAHHQEINAADSFAARAWNNLLDGPIQQIQAYHASGIKQKTISEIVNGLVGLGLLGIIGAQEAN
jgi:hypothetical protein